MRKHHQWQRSTVLGVALFVQMGVLWCIIYGLCHRYVEVQFVFQVLRIWLVLWIINSSRESAFRICWLLLVLPFPVVGSCLFLRFGGLGIFRASSYSCRKGVHLSLFSSEISSKPILSREVKWKYSDHRLRMPSDKTHHLYHNLMGQMRLFWLRGCFFYKSFFSSSVAWSFYDGFFRFYDEKKKGEKTQLQERTEEINGIEDKNGHKKEHNPVGYLQMNYLEQAMGYCGYQGCEVRYLSSGEAVFQTMKQGIRRGKSYIFLEFFIIHQGEFWREILELLQEKVKQGVCVRILYDDVGCLLKLPCDFKKKMKECSIEAMAFHPLGGWFTSHWNQRNHRKLLVVDGVWAVTGGVNIADEYINIHSPFGHWKDCGVLVEGRAVWSMTCSFLALWWYSKEREQGLVFKGKKEEQRKQQEVEKKKFYPEQCPIFQVSDWVFPYNSIPEEVVPVARQVFLNMVSRATKFVWITTPYLILDSGVESVLCQVANMGVDVKIITPAVADKKLVHQVTRGQYAPLVGAGVEILEYHGFIHGKTVVVDGEFATVGTVNLDFRSLFLHLEQGLWLWNKASVSAVVNDFQDILTKSTLVPRGNPPFFLRLFRGLLRVFAPLL